MNKSYQQNQNQGTIYNADQITINNALAPPPPLTSIPQNITYIGTNTFVGRGEELQKIDQSLTNSSQLAITSAIKSVTGMGGVGKTELSVQYALRYQQNYKGGICWVEARRGDIDIQIVGFCQSFITGIPEDCPPIQKLKYCWNHWTDGNVLLIFDDVQSYTDIKDYLPPRNSKFKVIVTSRQRLGKLEQLPLQVLKPPQALELLKQIIGTDRVNQELEKANQLCEWLGYLPLGLELVGRYLTTYENLSLTKVLERLEDKKLQARALLDPPEDEGDMTAQLGVAAAFELSYEKLSLDAQKLGCYLSLFKSELFDWVWVETSNLYPHDDEDEQIENLEMWRDEELRKFSLLQMSKEEGQKKPLFNYHPLVSLFFESKFQELENGEEFKRKFCQTMAKVAKSIEYQPTKQKIEEFTIIVPHIITIVTEMIDNAEEEDLISLFISLGKYHVSQGMYQKGEPYCKKYLEITLTKFTDTHLYTANAYNALGIISYYQDNYQEAEDNYQKSLEIRKRLLLSDHRDIADSFNNLGQLYLTQRNYEKAEDYLIKALKMRERLYQRESSDIANLDIAQSLANLAGLYCKKSELLKSSIMYRRFGYFINQQHQEMCNKALDFCEKAFKIRVKILGNLDYYVIQTKIMLGEIYHISEKHQESENYFRQALQDTQELLGEKHIQIVYIRNGLGIIYAEQGYFDKGINEIKKALELSQELLGETHSRTISIRENLQNIYNDSQNRFGF